MSYVKLDTGILRSTLWMDREAREVFITALLMAEPIEYAEPAQQMLVDSLEFTGWEAPPGWYGFVPAAGVGIINSAGIDRSAGMDALRRLGEPDHESRSQAHGGRRMIRVNGGYLILNYVNYRDKDHTTAERSRRYRERLKSKVVHPSPLVSTVVTRGDVTVTRDITHADADADVDAIKTKNCTAAAPPRKGKVSSETIDPEWTLDFKLLYPPRAGDPNWRGAWRAANARIAEGHTEQEFLEGARRYGQFIAATGKAGTEFVQQASTFLGPSKPFLLPWASPAKAETAMERIYRLNGGEEHNTTRTFDHEQHAISSR